MGYEMRSRRIRRHAVDLARAWGNLESMRTLVLAAFAVFVLLAGRARAEDTKPPAISDVKASVKGGQVYVEARITDETGVLSAIVHHRSAGGKVEDTQLVKNEYDDIFKASFPGSSETEYWIESSDLLGNGPSTYGSSSKAFAVGGKTGKSGGSVVASKEPPPKREERPPKKEERPPKREETAQQDQSGTEPQRTGHHGSRVAKAAEPPIIEHRPPSAQPPEGRDFTVRMKIKSDSPVAVAILQSRASGAGSFNTTQLTHTEGDSYEAVIPSAQAKGSVEYFIAAKNEAGLMTRQGNGDAKTPYQIAFKPAATPGAQVASAGPYQFAHLPLYRVQPARPIVVRAQIVASAEGGDVPDHVAVLWRGNDAQDQFTEMVPDPTGGYGGFKAELPAQDEGGIYYQIVACDSGAARCADDTGSKRKWHSAAVSAQPGGAQPMPIDVPSSKAPPALPE
jgi:hypothetical protein